VSNADGKNLRRLKHILNPPRNSTPSTPPDSGYLQDLITFTNAVKERSNDE
jgi:hypothetical protein